MTDRGPTIWIVSELFHPEETSTGHFLTAIAVGLGNSFRVSVLCSQPTYSQRGQRAPWYEQYQGVHIFRCWSTIWDRNYLPFKFVNLITVSLSLFLNALRRIQRGDRVLVVTTPLLLPYLITLSCWVKGATPLLLVYDVFPEVLGVSGVCSTSSFLFRLLDRLSSWLYRRMTRVVVIGRDMARLVRDKGADPGTLEIITNWADLNEITPTQRDANPVLRELGLADRFVVQYCGNMGLTHGLDDLLEVAHALGDQHDIHFLMIGSGARYEWLKRAAGDGARTNVSVLPRCPRSQLNDYLNACDIAVVSLMPGMSGVSVPSRMYNIMAAGKPILAITDDDSELALTIREEGIGWVVAPGDQQGVVMVIREARDDPTLLQTMGPRARRVAQAKFSQERVIGQYRELFASL